MHSARFFLICRPSRKSQTVPETSLGTSKGDASVMDLGKTLTGIWVSHRLMITLTGPPLIASLLQFTVFRKLGYALGRITCLTAVLYPPWLLITWLFVRLGQVAFS